MITGGGIPMYWNWVLDWVIPDGTLNNYPCIGIYYHTTPRGNFVYKLGTILSSNGLEGGQGWLVFGVLNSGTIGKLGWLKAFMGCVLE